MKILFVSPHLDDAVLSCGGLISKEVRLNNSEVYVLNIFTGLPEANNLSDAAIQFHQSCGLGPNAIEIRRKEEIAASKELGFIPLFLDQFESQYRFNEIGKHFYASFDEVFEGKAEKEGKLISILEQEIADIQEKNRFDAIFIPLSIGNHVDHVITRKSIENLSKTNLFTDKIKYYEDMPYAHQGVQGSPYIDNSLSPALELIHDIDYQRKLHAIGMYASQARMLWQDKDHMIKVYEEYSSFISNQTEVYYERYWLKKS